MDTVDVVSAVRAELASLYPIEDVDAAIKEALRALRSGASVEEAKQRGLCVLEGFLSRGEAFAP